MAYDLKTARYLSFGEARQSFHARRDTPRDYLERCLARIAELEPKVRRVAAVRPPWVRSSRHRVSLRKALD